MALSLLTTMAVVVVVVVIGQVTRRSNLDNTVVILQTACFRLEMSGL